VTLTPPVFNSARNIFFLVTGEEKADILSNVLNPSKSAVRYPARRIKPADGTVTWYLDQKAASKLKDRPVNF
jgi:6-phosphogluconolactonase